MSSKRGRNRSSTATSDKRSDDSKGSPESAESESQKPSQGITFEYETEDGLKISLDPTSAELSREFEMTENDFIELSAGIDWSPADMKIEKKGLDLDVSGSLELPGDALGFSAGIIIDLGSGEISGGEVGVEFAGAEVEVSVEGEKGCKKSISISFMGIGIGYLRDDCNKNEDTDDNESEDDIKQPSANSKRLTPQELGQRMINSSCSVVFFSVCFFTVFNWDKKLNWWSENSFNSEKQGGMGEGFQAYDHPTSFIDYRGVIISQQLGMREYARIIKSEGGFSYGEPIGKPQQLITQYVYAGFRVYPNGTIYYGDNPLEFYGSAFSNALVYWIAPPGDNSTCNIKDIRRSRNKPRIPPSPPPRKINSMNECCRESTQLMREIHKVLDCREMISKGVSTPNRWIAAGGKKNTKNKTYLELMVFQMRMMDHLGIHPFTAEVTDVNAAQEGNQSVAIEFANATAAVKQIAELLLENKGDSSTRLNLMIRTAVAVGQILNVVSIIFKTIEGIVQYLGMPIREKIYKVKMPFDFTFGARNGKKSGQGFGKKPGGGSDALNINTEEATEALLPKFMQDSEQPIVVEDFDDRESDLTDIIRGK